MKKYITSNIRYIATNAEPETKSNNINYFLASGNLCRLLNIFANRLDPDQPIGPYLDPKLFDILMVFPKEFFFKCLI